jgi:uncharacterized protein YdbL (DUF1318 family)
MTTRRAFIATLIAVFVIPATSLFAADSKKEELQKRFRARYGQVQQLKKDGVIGETDEGFVDFVKERDSKAADLVDQENADRRELYKLIAKNEGTDEATVAKHNAQRNFEKAKAGEYLRVDGKWKKKT